jgi:hypothetical protein
MTLNQTSGLYEFAIPGQEAGTLMKYCMTAYDNAGNIATNDNAGQYYVYTVIPEFPSLVLISFLMVVALLAIQF